MAVRIILPPPRQQQAKLSAILGYSPERPGTIIALFAALMGTHRALEYIDFVSYRR